MLARGIARDLGADHTRRVALAARAVDPADALAVDALDLERAGARAIMRAHAGQDVERQDRAPRLGSRQDIRMSRSGRYATGRAFLPRRRLVTANISRAKKAALGRVSRIINLTINAAKLTLNIARDLNLFA